ncbi:MAG: LSM domain-containing protein [uncultured Clostridium sp.]
MAIEVVGFYRDNESLYNECKKCISYYSVIVLSNGAKLEGIIEEVINDSLSILVAEEVMESEYESEMNRQQYMGYRQQGRFRRFNRRRFPMKNINSERPIRFPYIIPFYPVYPYPYPYPYPYYPY